MYKFIAWIYKICIERRHGKTVFKPPDFNMAIFFSNIARDNNTILTYLRWFGYPYLHKFLSKLKISNLADILQKIGLA